VSARSERSEPRSRERKVALIRRYLDPVKLLPALIAPLGALAIALIVSTVVLSISGKQILPTFQTMYEYGTQPDSIVEMFNKATPYYLAAVAAAIGFRMALFNIGVDGQARLGGVLAAALGGASFLGWLPGPLRIVLIIVAAMAIGAAWAGVAAILKVTRGVSEVISTIMLNFIGGAIVAYLISPGHLGVQAKGANDVTTPILKSDSWLPNLPLVSGTDKGVFSFAIGALIIGAGYWYVLGRTRFGFDLRATGWNPPAAVASGIDAKRMVVTTMLLSGGVAGLVGLPELFGQLHAETSQSIGGLGFTGIAIALLGRNHPIGMALGALLWGFLERSALVLDLNEIPKETVTIMQGTTVLAVVVAYELSTRLARRIEQRRVGESTGAAVQPLLPAGSADEVKA
jgi:ABC-type uncharacterized transport system permease subunit